MKRRLDCNPSPFPPFYATIIPMIDTLISWLCATEGVELVMSSSFNFLW